MCPDCEQNPCQCAEWQRQMDRMDERDAEVAAEMAATMLPYLWETGPEGLLRRKR